MQPLRRGLAVGLAITSPFVVAPVIGEFFVKWAEQAGYYADPSGQMEAAVTWLLSVASFPGFQFTAGLVVGLALGMWLDAFLRRREEGRPEGKEQPVKPARLQARETELRVKISDCLADLSHFARHGVPREGYDPDPAMQEKVDRVWPLFDQISCDDELASDCRRCAKYAMVVVSRKFNRVSSAEMECKMADLGKEIFAKLY